MSARLATLALLACALGISERAYAQTKPTAEELKAWANDKSTLVLETTPCKELNWLLEKEQTEKPIRIGLGWWGRGFIEGALYIINVPAIDKKAQDFGLTVDVVASHISAYCYTHEKETPYDAIQKLILQIMQ